LTLPTAVARDVTLPELVSEVAELYHRIGRDETFVTAAVDAVDHNAVLLGEVLVRLAAVENNLGSAEGVVLQHKADATANAAALDAKLRAELDLVTSRLGTELRAENARMEGPLNVLKGIALGAAAAVRSAATASPPGIPSSDALEAALTTLDGRTTQLSAAVHGMTADLTLLGAQVSALQQAAPAKHSSSAASAGAADASSAADGGIARDEGRWEA
jgi:hypothetical protein